MKNNPNDLKKETYIPSTVNSAVQEKLATVKILPTSEQWFGVTYQEDREDAVNKIKIRIESGVYPEKLF